MKTNILGTSNLLENALYYWDKNNQISKKYLPVHINR